MNTKARSGCVACAALLEAVDVFFFSSNNKDSSRPPNEELEFRLEFDIRRGQEESGYLYPGDRYSSYAILFQRCVKN